MGFRYFGGGMHSVHDFQGMHLLARMWSLASRFNSDMSSPFP